MWEEGRELGNKPQRGFFFAPECTACSVLRASNNNTKLGAERMTISKAQLRTLRLLNKQAAHRVYRSKRAGDYIWTHEDSRIALTQTLHRLFSSGYATVSNDNRDVAVITQKGRAAVAARGFC